MNIRQKPHTLFIIVAIFLFSISFFVIDKSFDIRMHDTYFVIANTFIFILLSFLCMCYWLIYKLTTKILISIILSRLHIILTLISILIIAFVITFDQNLFEIAISNGIQFADINLVIRNSSIVLFLIFSIAQTILVINLIGGIFNRMRQSP